MPDFYDIALECGWIEDDVQEKWYGLKCHYTECDGVCSDCACKGRARDKIRPLDFNDE